MKYVYSVLAIAFCTSIYYTPKQLPDESNLHYILSDANETWQDNLSILIASICLTIIIMRRLLRNRE